MTYHYDSFTHRVPVCRECSEIRKMLESLSPWDFLATMAIAICIGIGSVALLVFVVGQPNLALIGDGVGNLWSRDSPVPLLAALGCLLGLLVLHSLG